MSKTGLVITITVITLGIYDLAVVVFSGTASSISQLLVDKSLDAPVMVFAFGFISGHLFGNMKPSSKEK